MKRVIDELKVLHNMIVKSKTPSMDGSTNLDKNKATKMIFKIIDKLQKEYNAD